MENSPPHPYLPNTPEDVKAMLATIGVEDVEELFADIPPHLRVDSLGLPPPLSEQELVRELTSLATQNLAPGPNTPCFLGGGAYRHYIPSTVRAVISRPEFYTAYTPYQAEISQGTLQTMFEFQTLVCELLGMEVANAGMYDGASALAEGCLMASLVTGRRHIALVDTIHPHYMDVVRTYAMGRGLQVEILPPQQIWELDESYACLAVQSPNFFGYLEDMEAMAQAAHRVGALLVTSTDPISLGLFRPPGEYDADVATAEGQSLGWPLSFGGPYLGLFASRREFLRQMPGRIVGRTTDRYGRTGYVLTLQTREQHIRRERATSNICTSQQLVALAATVYLTTLGPHGLRRIAQMCYHKAHYLAQRLASLPGYRLPLRGVFFKEFVVECPRPPQEVNAILLERGIVGGLDVSSRVERGLLLCVTEVTTREEMDLLVGALASLSPR